MTTTPASGAADLIAAAQAVVDRWDTPLWKDAPATAEYIGRLRAALASAPAQPVAEPAPSATAHVGDSLFESWFSEYNPAHRGTKQQMRDAYAAGMGDPKAQPSPTPQASHGQAPSHVLHLVQDAFAEVAMAYPKAFALHKVGIADTAVRGALAGHTPQADSQPAPDERDDFEKVFPLPSGCIRVGTGYASTGYSNWAAHTHCERWQGWQAHAAHGQAPAGANENAELVTLIAECRDAFPIPAHGDPIENYWSAAIEDPANVPAYLQEIAKRKQADSVQEDAARSERERICAAIKVEDDYCVEQGDYMLDSDDCIKIARGDWVRPDFSVDAARKQGENHD